MALYDPARKRKRRSSRVYDPDPARRRRRLTAVGRGIGGIMRKVLLGVGGGALASALIKNLGVDLKGFEGLIPHGVAFMTGGLEGAIANVVVSGIPTFWGTKPSGGDVV